MASSSDYEQYGYDANDNRTSFRKRDGSVLTYTYDAMNRVSQKTVPSRTGLPATYSRDVFYQYDIRGLETQARFDSTSGQGVVRNYDAYGREANSTVNLDGATRTLTFGYDQASNRTSVKFPDNIQFGYQYTSGGQFDHILSPSNETIADFVYTNKNELQAIARDGSAADQTWSYDALSRVAGTSITGGFSTDVSWGFGRNPASQIVSQTQSNDGYAWRDYANFSRTYTTNGLNQYTEISGGAYCYDANGNLTFDGANVYLYDVENRLVEMRDKVSTSCPSATSGYTGTLYATLRYDPLGRLYEVKDGPSGNITRFLHDGDALVAEYNSSGTLLKRYIHGPAAGIDDPLVEYSGTGVAASDRRNLYSDARGSVVLTTSTTGSTIALNTYDEYGQPGQSNGGRFQYTGQAWMPEIGMYYYKARIYSPVLGRFLQNDPIGYEDQVNLYSYAANDPINSVDYSGEEVVYIGSPQQRKLMQSALRTAARSDPELKRRYLALVSSSHRHEIVFEKPFGKAGRSSASMGGPFAERPIGSRVGIDPVYQRGPDQLGQNLSAMLAHELLGHSYNWDTGTMPKGTNPDTGVPWAEHTAMDAQNAYNRGAGRDPQKEYGGEPLEPKEKQNSRFSIDGDFVSGCWAKASRIASGC